MEERFEIILDKLITSTRSPRGQFSKANGWRLLEKRLRRIHRYSLTFRTTATAAAIALFCGMGFWMYETLSPAPLHTISTLTETRIMTLPDQTRVVLNRYSSLTYPEKFKGGDRKVRLQGEAYFEVTKDASQPFKVETEKLQVRVLGTHFNIDAYPNDLQVKTTLLEGSVLVTTSGTPHKQVRLKPNESVIYDKKSDCLTMTSEADASKEIAWRNGIISFNNESLQEIIRQLSNTYHTNIQITDIQIQNYRMTATFSDKETLDEVLSLLCRNQKFKYTKKDNNTITITQKLD